ncbi:histidine phosphatase family protein [Streptomyces ferrugineus]|uniref:Histidine phosphatase family protein n=1 Tax=Streptomyces ferrugineus TaxID=1413221 RepID=A0A7M2SCW9_9ACTN|nr:histidine phosphatase family protein [Streptomyces ferrugineus]QOV33859.1 histidine phosphatase family protein [Streptomyces ferrugineus]
MTVRLMLVCAAAPTGREVRFADTVPDERALRQARSIGDGLPSAGLRCTAPSQRCRRTATALGWDAVPEEPALRALDMGRWQGRSLDEVAADEPDALGAWLTDPQAAPHAGESVAELCRRVAAWADGLLPDAGRVQAVVDQAVARAAVVHALSAPERSFWRVDVPPLTVVQLTGRGGRWNLRMGTATSGDGQDR